MVDILPPPSVLHSNLCAILSVSASSSETPRSVSGGSGSGGGGGDDRVRSDLDRSSTVNVGSLMLKYGGGGHQAVGTCRVSRDEADTVMSELIAHIGAAYEQAVSET